MTYYNNGEETIRHEAVSRLIHFHMSYTFALYRLSSLFST